VYGFRYYFTPLTGVLFTFPSRYWFTIGHQQVFSLGGWSPRIPTGFHVSCGTWVSRTKSLVALLYRAVTFCGRPFQIVRLATRFITLQLRRIGTKRDPSTPMTQRTRAITRHWFGLFPFRSPLLRESRLLSFPRGTEMFQFPRLASSGLWIHPAMVRYDSDRVSPFGHPRIGVCLRLPEAYRSLPRPSSPADAKASTVHS
jgi:hypothetical protein